MTQLVNGGLVTALVTFLVSLFAPFIESLPGLSDTTANKARHDAVLQLLNVALNIGGVALFLAASKRLTGLDIIPIVLQGLIQASGSHFLYRVVAGPPSSGSAVDAPPDGASAFFGSTAASTPQQQ